MYDLKNKRAFLKRREDPDRLRLGPLHRQRRRRLLPPAQDHRVRRPAHRARVRGGAPAHVRPRARARVSILGKIVNAATRSGFAVAELKAWLLATDANDMYGDRGDGALVAGGGDEGVGFRDEPRRRVRGVEVCRARDGARRALRRRCVVYSKSRTPAPRAREGALLRPPRRLPPLEHHAVPREAQRDGAPRPGPGRHSAQKGSRFAARRHLRSIASTRSSFEVYKGVVPEFNALVDDHLGELRRGRGGGTGGRGRRGRRGEVPRGGGAGGRRLRACCDRIPLRAQIGFDKVRNAVHCTDLPEDGARETHYFFKILQEA